jgi:hypothetical protein
MRIKSYVERATQQSYSHSLVGARVYTKQTLPLPFQYKLATAYRPVYLLIFLVAWSGIRTTDPGRLQRVSTIIVAVEKQ